MKKLKILSILLLVAVGLSTPVFASQPTANNSGNSDVTEEIQELTQAIHDALPKSAEGYAWVLFRGVAIQRPTHWNEFEKNGAYCSSIESVPDKGIFETGVTIHVYRDVSKQYNVSPTVLAVKYVKQFEDLEENTEIFFKTNAHPDSTESIIYRFKNKIKNQPDVIVHKYFLINEKEDFVNVVTFETTEAKWGKLWEKEGTTILGAVIGIPYFE